MQFVNLSPNEFDQYSQSSEYSSFHQSSYWGKLKETNGWIAHYVGVKEDDKILAASLLLEKTAVKVVKMFYAPKGFLINYHNKDLCDIFFTGVKKYVADKGAILLKVDPYVDEVELDLDGQVVENGYNNQDIKQVFADEGFKLLLNPDGSKKTSVLNSIFVLELNQEPNELMKGFSKHVKQSIKTSERYGVIIEDLDYEGLTRFKKMLEETASRRGFIDRSLAYYQNMYQIFGPEYLRFRMACLDVDVYKQSITKRLAEAEKELSKLKGKKEANPENTRYDGSIKEAQITVDANQKRLLEANEIEAKYGKKVDLSCACYFNWGNEIVNLYGGNNEDLLQYAGQYALHWDMIKKAYAKGCKRYNFYGIPDDLSKDGPMYGVYEIKRGFKGHVVRFIGEFDYIAKPFMYKMYNLAMSIYVKLK